MKSLILSDRDIQSINLWISKMNYYEDQDRKQKVKNAKRTLRFKYKIIGYGWHRIVYKLNNGYILKVAISNHGFKSNETEYKVYTNCPSELRKSLCPVKEIGHGWIIMEKMASYIPVTKVSSEKLSELENKFLKYRIDPKDIMNRSNLVLSKTGEITVIDYGDFIMN
jgi:hypothetical protein